MCGTGNAEVTLKGHDRKHFVVVPLDGAFTVKDMAPSIQALKKAAAASNGAVGVGLLSMMGFELTRNELSVSLLLFLVSEGRNHPAHVHASL